MSQTSKKTEPAPAKPAAGDYDVPATKPKKGRKAVDPNETPRDCFKRVIAGRVKRALKALDALGDNASALRKMLYSENDLKSIVAAVDKAKESAVAALRVGMDKNAKVAEDGPAFSFE